MTKISILHTYTPKESHTEKFTKPLRGVLGGRTVQAGMPDKGQKFFKLWERVLVGSVLFTVGIPYTLIAGGILAFSSKKGQPTPQPDPQPSPAQSKDASSSVSTKSSSPLKAQIPRPRSNSLEVPQIGVDSPSNAHPLEPIESEIPSKRLDFKRDFLEGALKAKDQEFITKLFSEDAKFDFNNIEVRYSVDYPPEFENEPKIYIGKHFLFTLPLLIKKDGKEEITHIIIERLEPEKWEYLLGINLYDMVEIPSNDHTVTAVMNILKGEQVNDLGFGFEAIGLYPFHHSFA